MKRPVLSLSFSEDGVLLMTGEVFLPEEIPPAIEKRFLSQCEGLKRRLSETVAPLLRKKYAASPDKRKRLTWSPFRLSVSVREISRTGSVYTYAETVTVFRKGKRLFFKEKTLRQRAKDGKYLPEKKPSRQKKNAKRNAKSEEKAKNC